MFVHLLLSKFRGWLRNLLHRRLYGHVLQHNHWMGGVLFMGVIYIWAALDLLQQHLEHTFLQARCSARQLYQCNESRSRIFWVFFVHLQIKNASHDTVQCFINYFRRSVLEQHRSNGLDYMGPIKPSLALCVFLVFVLVYFSMWKGVRSAGKVVWVTALAPYVVLLFLLVRGVTLPGASEGIRYYLTPEWHKLKNSKVHTRGLRYFNAIRDYNLFKNSMETDWLIVFKWKYQNFTNFFSNLCRFGLTPHRKYSSHWDLVLVLFWRFPATINLITIVIGMLFWRAV